MSSSTLSSFTLYPNDHGVGEPYLSITGIHLPQATVIINAPDGSIQLSRADIPFVIESLTKIITSVQP